MGRLLFLLLLVALAFANDTRAPQYNQYTSSPQTKPPQTKPPQPKPPQTKPPQTKPPQTKPPQTKPPQTKPPHKKPTQKPSTECTFSKWTRMEPDGPIAKPIGWTRIGEPDPKTVITLNFVLKHDPKAIQTLTKKLFEISDPTKPDYGKWLSLKEVTKYVAASKKELDSISKFLGCFGIRNVTVDKNQDSIRVSGTVKQLEKALYTKFATFQYKDGRTTANLIVKPYSLPATVAGATCTVTNLIHPLVQGTSAVTRTGGRGDPPPTAPPILRTAKKLQSHLQQTTSVRGDSGNWTTVGNWNDACDGNCDGAITPTVIREQYGIVNPTPSYHCVDKPRTTTLAVVSLHKQFWDNPDLQQFENQCDEDIPNVLSKNFNDPNVCLSGTPEFGLPPCSESLVDVQYAASIATSFSADVSFSTYDFLRDPYDWLIQANNEESPALVQSFSYGVNEFSVSTDWKICLNEQLLKLSARGVTIVVASGDNGVYGVPTDEFTSNATRRTFIPVAPASSPFVLSVGGTELIANDVGRETCSYDGGGGFSNFFSRPNYQNQAVDGYLLSVPLLPPQNLWNISGRAYPDVSALYGAFIPYCYSRGLDFVRASGTSISAPVVAGMITLLNEIRFRYGAPQLGFINPWLYKIANEFPQAFNDIVTDYNPGDGPTGFNAFRGWDPCSGVGSPRFNVLSQIVENDAMNLKQHY